MTQPDLFHGFAPPVRKQSALRRAITAAYRRSEPECILPLVKEAVLPDEIRGQVRRTAHGFVSSLRAKPKGGGIEALVQEYALSSREGVALMCLAEALLRIPDTATRDALIRDKIADGDWKSHLGAGRSPFANAATWGLAVTGKLLESADDRGLAAALGRLIARAGEPVIRRAVDLAMRMMGQQFVIGETIGEALRRSGTLETKGFTYSYDMLGEAAMTAQDAERYSHDYETAIHRIGAVSAARNIYEAPGISVKLSALHPRYSRQQANRVMAELLPAVKALARLAKSYGVGFNIDAEEADRLELSLDLFENLAFDPDLAEWDGLGFVAQAYGKRCPFVIDWIIDLARRANRRIMVRLVKGAYWDMEIKRAQVDGLVDFPVYTRKAHTDVAYIACARRLLAAREVIFPQFATHNAQTVATIYHIAGPDFRAGDYEFQCLHGMGEELYEQIVGDRHLGRPCRIYAPVGTHETLLAYLVRRLLENGANSSFVNQIGNPSVPIEALVADPVEIVRAGVNPGSKHEKIVLPSGLYPGRLNSSGLDLSDESVLALVSKALKANAAMRWSAGDDGKERPVLNPADHRDIVGTVREVSPADAEAAMARAARASWAGTPVIERAAMLERAADAMQAHMLTLLGLIMREAGKSLPNAIAEIREAIDFLHYYAQQARETLEGTEPLGPIVCISPWNFPFAIFTGQISAALAAGNPVVAKPAEETPLIAAEAVRILHEAGIPAGALQLICGAGDIGAALVAAPETAGVMFTGSTEVARLIQMQIATRLSPFGKSIPLVAETGGQNAMIVDSSALAEQVVADIMASAFDSAGQRCSALRILCLQEEIADRMLAMLKGALKEQRIGRTDKLSIDIGPVITADAKTMIEKHIAAMRAGGHKVEQMEMPPENRHGTFVAPTIIELDSIADLKREIFGPVLHVVRYKRDALDSLIDAINATGYGLTFGLHTRLDETMEHVISRVKAGNLYINRNMIGAVVGVQPFGGCGLSGTGPKAGGPLYLARLVQGMQPRPANTAIRTNKPLIDFINWLNERNEASMARLAQKIGASSLLGTEIELPGPVGERNIYTIHPRGPVLLRPLTLYGLFHQLAAALATGNLVAIEADGAMMALINELPSSVRERITSAPGPVSALLVEGGDSRILEALREVADSPGPIIQVQGARSKDMLSPGAYNIDLLIEEVSTSINITAAGGNASLMALDG